MDSFGARSTLHVGPRVFEIFRLDALQREGIDVSRLPYSLRILLENLLRHEDGVSVTRHDILALATWDAAAPAAREFAFTPGRVLLQDFTGVPAVVDLAAMRDAMRRLGGDPSKINPLQPVELVIDHSIQAGAFGTSEAFALNEALEYRANAERYSLLKWAQRAFRNLTVAPPNAGICHQINLESLARVVFGLEGDGHGVGASGLPQAYPDTLVGTDSHTPMVNGVGVLGWGVGGIEAEAVMLGQPLSMLLPEVIGVHLTGALREGTTATDLVLTIAQLLRKRGVVGRFVEFFGPGVSSLSIADRATIGNMSPEYGSTCAIFPVDAQTLRYLELTGRPRERVELVERYMREQGLFHTPEAPEPRYTDVLRLDLSSVEPSLAGPRRPHDRLPLSRAGIAFAEALPSLLAPPGRERKVAAAAPAGGDVGVWGEGDLGPDAGPSADETRGLRHGSVVLAAITSCTNTSNPSVMMAAGLLAKKAVGRGLRRQPWVKTTLAPGSLVVTDYYERAGLTKPLEALGFHLVGYGCTTCIGNSGPLPAEVERQVREGDLVVAAVLSGNRNFEGRIHSQVRANYLMSPPLVVAFAIAGRVDIDMVREPLGHDPQGRPVFLRDVWPTQAEVEEAVRKAIDPHLFRARYERLYEGNERWRALPSPEGDLYRWDETSTYVREPPFFVGMTAEPPAQIEDVRNARALLMLADFVTTDHISPAGGIPSHTPAGQHLLAKGVLPREFNSYGARRGNYKVLVRGTFANVRIRNQLAPGTEGGFTTHIPSGEVMSVFDAATRYKEEGVPLVVLAGREYGSGSSRDWAAKGPFLMGVKATLAESYERIHRSNLVGMGVLPLQYREGQNARTLGLTGRETFDIVGVAEAVAGGPRELHVRAHRADGTSMEFVAIVRIDTPQESEYYRHGGILQYVLRQLLTGRKAPPARGPGLKAAALKPRSAAADGEAADEASIASHPASDPPAY